MAAPVRSRCTLCGDLGWVLDCNDLGKPGPRMVEMLPCLLPDCEYSGQPLQSVNFSSVRFQSVSRHPSEGFVMSVHGQTLKLDERHGWDFDTAARVIRGLLYNDDDRAQSDVEVEATRFLSGQPPASASKEEARDGA